MYMGNDFSTTLDLSEKHWTDHQCNNINSINKKMEATEAK